MHRVRQSVSYFEAFGWKPTVVMVDPAFTETIVDPLLTQTLPDGLDIVEVKAFSTRWTRKVGLGSLALRSLWFYFQKVNELLKEQRYDLIYFSTTMFPVLILGAYWKKQFGIPYVIDMQDPWHSEYLLRLPKHERPAKFWFSYRLNKYLEPIAMKSVDGIISVSQGYCDDLQKRYANIGPQMCTVIPFGAFSRDFEVLRHKKTKNQFFSSSDGLLHIVYVGMADKMNRAINLLLDAFNLGIRREGKLFGKVRMHFVGTSYAPGSLARPTIAPLAKQKNLEAYVEEHPTRVPYFDALQLLQEANMLLMLGNDDTNYTASKLYPYIMAQKPILAFFNRHSSVNQILQHTRAGEVVAFDNEPMDEALIETAYQIWSDMLRRLPFTPATNWRAFEPFMAREMTSRQVDSFNAAIGKSLQTHPMEISLQA